MMLFISIFLVFLVNLKQRENDINKRISSLTPSSYFTDEVRMRILISSFKVLPNKFSFRFSQLS